MSADEAASKITAGMKGMYARRQVRSAPILSAMVDSALPLHANRIRENHCRRAALSAIGGTSRSLAVPLCRSRRGT